MYPINILAKTTESRNNLGWVFAGNFGHMVRLSDNICKLYANITNIVCKYDQNLLPKLNLAAGILDSSIPFFSASLPHTRPAETPKCWSLEFQLDATLADKLVIFADKSCIFADNFII